MKLKRHGRKIDVTLDSNDPLCAEILRNIAETLKANGREREYQEIRAMAQEPPEIDPGG